MGNCNSQNLARALEDKCSSGGLRNRRHTSSSSSSSSSSASSSSMSAPNGKKLKLLQGTAAAANAHQKSGTAVVPSSLKQQQQQQQREATVSEYDRSKVIVIDEATGPEVADLAQQSHADTRTGAARNDGTNLTSNAINDNFQDDKHGAANNELDKVAKDNIELAIKRRQSCQADELGANQDRSKLEDDQMSVANKLEKLKGEGLDFIETEEDVKAVEAATLKIQSTFRGKKFRSKLTPTKTAAPQESAGTDKKEKEEAVQEQKQQQVNTSAGQQQTSSKSSSTKADPTTSKLEQTDSDELSKRIDEMQVNDNNENNNGQHEQPQIPGGLPENEADRAATKIQAGFKGYKTRKELEGKLPTGSAGGTAQQAAADK